MKNINKIFHLILFTLLIFVSFGCDVETDFVPEEDFTLNSFIFDGMVLSSNTVITISGTSVDGATIKLQISDEYGKVYKNLSSIVSEDGDFNFKFKTPKASNTSYILEFSDGNSAHLKKYSNVLFGKLFTFLGDYIPDVDDVFEFSDTEKESIKIMELGEHNWKSISESSNYNAINIIIHKIYESYNYPIGVINLSSKSTFLDYYLSSEVITKYKTVNKYVDSLSHLDDEKTSYIYNEYLDELKELHVDSIFWYQGAMEYAYSFLIDNFITLYNYTLFNLFNQLSKDFEDCDIYTLQIGYHNFAFINELRKSQAYPSYHIENVNLIPIFDCYVEDGDSVILDSGKYIERISSLIIDKTLRNKSFDEASSLSNIIVNNNTIKLSFSTKDSIIDVKSIYELVVKDEDENEIDYSFVIENNTIILTIVKDVTMIHISYGQNLDNYKCNLFTTDGLPVIPFDITITL